MTDHEKLALIRFAIDEANNAGRRADAEHHIGSHAYDTAIIRAFHQLRTDVAAVLDGPDDERPAVTTKDFGDGYTLSMEDGHDSLGTYYALGIVKDADGTEVYRHTSPDWYRTQGACGRWLNTHLNAKDGAPETGA